MSEKESSTSNIYAQIPTYDPMNFRAWSTAFSVSLKNDLNLIIHDKQSKRMSPTRPLEEGDGELTHVELQDAERKYIKKYIKLNKQLYQCLFYSVSKRSDEAGLSTITGPEQSLC